MTEETFLNACRIVRTAGYTIIRTEELQDVFNKLQRIRAKCTDDQPHPHHDHLCPDDIVKLLDGEVTTDG